MANLKGFFCLFFLLVGFVSSGMAQEYQLQYFLNICSLSDYEFSKKERTELLSRIEDSMRQVEQVEKRMSEIIQVGELDLRYKDMGKFLISKLQDDEKSIETGMQQLKSLREKPTHLVAAIKLYKSLRDLSANFNDYNNVPSFSSLVGDMGPEMDLWTDPIFYKLYLLPLASLKNVEPKPPLPPQPKKAKTSSKKKP